jgi:hypothetical protein
MRSVKINEKENDRLREENRFADIGQCLTHLNVGGN